MHSTSNSVESCTRFLFEMPYDLCYDLCNLTDLCAPNIFEFMVISFLQRRCHPVTRCIKKYLLKTNKNCKFTYKISMWYFFFKMKNKFFSNWYFFKNNTISKSTKVLFFLNKRLIFYN